MTDEEVKNYIDISIKRTLEEVKRKGMLKGSDNTAYTDASEMIASYYRDGKADAGITYAIQGLRFDPYFRIIPLFFEQKKTIEQIACIFGVDERTIMRNKKRLCLSLYNDII